jgi:hypothetical protein
MQDTKKKIRRIYFILPLNPSKVLRNDNLGFWNYVEGFAIWKDVMSKYAGKL